MVNVTETKIQTIRGGWRNVPEHLKTKTQLNQMGLKPTGEPVAEVWSAKQWCKLYDVKETKEKKKPTEKQLAALQKAREKREENERLRYEEEQRAMEEEQQWHQEQHWKSWKEGLTVWYESDFVILDTETTDLDGEIIEISIIDKQGNVLLDTLVNPKTEISNEAYNVHGISKEALKDAPTWPEVLPKVSEILKDRLILIYNDEFDIRMIHNSCYNWELESPNLVTDCVMRSYANFYNIRWVSLEVASGNYVSHRALGDCFSTLQVVQELWKELDIGK